MQATLEKPTPTVTPAPAKKAGLKKVSFGAAAVKKTETKTAYPVFEDEVVGEQVREIAARIKQRQSELEALEGALKTDRAELKQFTAPFYFKVNAGRREAPSSISIPSKEGEVLVTFQNRYGKLEDEAILEPILVDKADQYLRQTFELKISGEDLPAGKEQEIVDAIMALLDTHGAKAALEVKEAIKPMPDFHARRLVDFTPEQNVAIEELYPIVAMVKMKGRENKN